MNIHPTIIRRAHKNSKPQKLCCSTALAGKLQGIDKKCIQQFAKAVTEIPMTICHTPVTGDFFLSYTDERCILIEDIWNCVQHSQWFWNLISFQQIDIRNNAGKSKHINMEQVQVTLKSSLIT